MSQFVTLNRIMKDSYHYSEAIKILGINIQFCGNGIKTITLISSLPDEGKSDITFAMASSLTQIGKGVVMIDVDTRKSVLVSRYQLEREMPGLSQYLSGRGSLGNVIYDTNIESFGMISAGPYSPNLAEFLEESLLGDIISKLKERYGYIIVDTPPTGNLIDGAIVVRQCDGAVMMTESGSTSYRLEQRVKGQLEKSGCRILGVVPNKANTERNGYYSKYYGKCGKYSKCGHYGKHDRYRKVEA